MSNFSKAKLGTTFRGTEYSGASPLFRRVIPAAAFLYTPAVFVNAQLFGTP
jgi:hypothetical protein